MPRGPLELHGRRRLVTDFTELTAENVKEALGAAMAGHALNEQEIVYLFNYYRGIQPVQQRIKDIRPDICYNTVINHASEIVAFKVSYLLSDPIVYVSRNGDGEVSEKVSKKIGRFNDYMHLAGKQACDKEIADDFTICGQAYRFVHANPDYPEKDESPLVIETLNPATTGVVYENTSAKHSKPVFAFTYVDRLKKLGRLTRVWTRDKEFTIERGVVTVQDNPLGMIPIVEYVNNEFRLGAFEPVLDLLNDANVLESNRIEATEQNVQSLLWFNDVELDDEQVERLKSKPNAFVFTRTIKDSQTPSIKNVAIELQQADQQVLSNDLYKKVLTIVGMPSTGDGNTSDSSNNGSTIVRNGWQHAEARAKDTATLWQRSDKDFLSIALSLCDDLPDSAGKEKLGLAAEDIVGKFTRRNYEDVMTKATVLTTLLGCNKVHPKVAYQASNLVPDPEEAYQEGLQWYEEQLARDIQTEQRRQEMRVEVNAGGNRSAETSGIDTGNQSGSTSAQYNRVESRTRQEYRTGSNSSNPD